MPMRWFRIKSRCVGQELLDSLDRIDGGHSEILGRRSLLLLGQKVDPALVGVVFGIGGKQGRLLGRLAVESGKQFRRIAGHSLQHAQL